MISGGYLLSCEVVRLMSTTLMDTKVNKLKKIVPKTTLSVTINRKVSDFESKTWEKIVEDKDLQNTKSKVKVAKEFYAGYKSNYVLLICIFLHVKK